MKLGQAMTNLFQSTIQLLHLIRLSMEKPLGSQHHWFPKFGDRRATQIFRVNAQVARNSPSSTPEELQTPSDVELCSYELAEPLSRTLFHGDDVADLAFWA